MNLKLSLLSTTEYLGRPGLRDSAAQAPQMNVCPPVTNDLSASKSKVKALVTVYPAHKRNEVKTVAEVAVADAVSHGELCARNKISAEWDFFSVFSAFVDLLVRFRSADGREPLSQRNRENEKEGYRSFDRLSKEENKYYLIELRSNRSVP